MNVIANYSPSLSPALAERVLERLGFSSPVEVTPAGLRDVYDAWCRRVPFDNVRKLIQVRTGETGPLPGHSAEDFFAAWLRWGTGGTCWAGANALHALLGHLGFMADRGVATMLVVPDLPPNHGTVQVALDGRRYLLDASILHGEPLPLDPDSGTEISHPAWGVRCEPRDGRWHVAWRPLHKVDGFECRLEFFGAGHPEYRERYEMTRGWSPFNYELSARLNQGDRVVGLGFGNQVSLEVDGTVRQSPAARADRVRVLVEELGMNEEIVARLPEDLPTPPPPGSQTAQREAAAVL